MARGALPARAVRAASVGSAGRGRRLDQLALTTDAALRAARFPMIEIIGTLDPAVSQVEPLRKAHPQIKMLVLEGATHGGEQGVLRRPETMTALKELWSSASSR